MSNVSSIPATTTNTDVGQVVYAAANPNTGQKTLGQDDFMKILATQLSTQDPMDPMKDEDFIAQMATFSSVGQSSQLNTAFTQFAANQGLANASSLIGKSVTVIDPNAGTVTGTVQGATLQAGTPTVVINGVSYDATDITQVTTAPQS